MKFTTNTTELRDACLKAERVTGKRNPLVVIHYILITATKDDLIIKSTDLDIGVEINVSGKVTTPGVWAVSGSVLGSFLSTVHTDQVTVELIGGSLTISAGKNNTLIKIIPPTDFPSIPQKEGQATFSIPTSLFTSTLHKISYAASNSQIKPEISGVYIYNDVNESKMCFVATDSFRLAESKIKLQKNNQNNIKAIIPIRNITEISRLFEGVGGDLSVWVTQSQISFLGGGVYCTSRLISGLYPNYQQILPKNFKMEFFINTQKIQEALKTSLIFTDTLNQITISVYPKESQIILVSKNEEVGESSITLEAEVKGEETSFNCNIRYLYDVFQSLNEETIVVKLNENNKPFIVQGFGNQDFTYLIMPMNR
jgi:DNA polymerase-3 subunit beta